MDHPNRKHWFVAAAITAVVVGGVVAYRTLCAPTSSPIAELRDRFCACKDVACLERARMDALAHRRDLGRPPTAEEYAIALEASRCANALLKRAE